MKQKTLNEIFGEVQKSSSWKSINEPGIVITHIPPTADEAYWNGRADGEALFANKILQMMIEGQMEDKDEKPIMSMEITSDGVPIDILKIYKAAGLTQEQCRFVQRVIKGILLSIETKLHQKPFYTNTRYE